MTRRRRVRVTEREVLRLVNGWLRLFEMSPPWRVGVRVNREPDDCGEEEHRDCQAFVTVSDDGGFQAVVEVNEYRLADPLEEVVAHEVFHVVSWRVARMAEAGAGRLREVVEAEVEDLVERTGRALARLARRSRAA